MDLLPEQQLERLLHQRRHYPQRANQIDVEIRTRFLQTRAILILDMSGLTLTTQEQGIIPALEEIYHLREVGIPLLEEHGGRLLKAEADNLYGVFEAPDQAVTAARSILARLQAAGLSAGIGIGYGDVLAVGERDLYGDQMNLTSRLGEDLAAGNQILLTEAAYLALPGNSWSFAPRQVVANGIPLRFYQLSQP